MISRTDRLLAAVTAEIEDQRAALDAGTPLTSVTFFAHLHPSGAVRSVKVRLDRQRDVGADDRRLLTTASQERMSE